MKINIHGLKKIIIFLRKLEFNYNNVFDLYRKENKTLVRLYDHSTRLDALEN